MPWTEDETDELRLQPVKETSLERVGDSPAKSNQFGVVREEPIPLTEVQRRERAQDSYNNTAGLYPRERHYQTLEAMQRLSKLFGYAALLTVLPYLAGRLVWILWTVDEGLLQELGTYSEFAIPTLFGVVGLIGLLWTISEGIRLAIDIQDNTLRIANQNGRRKD